MDKYIVKELDKRYEGFKADPDSKRTKAVIDMALQAYLPENTKSRPEKLDSEFRAFAFSHIRLFVFVGHDSASSTICYILHLLAINPYALARVRAEHDKVLGPDLQAVPSLLKEHAHLTNHLAYTTTVIKEALRLFPPGGCSRAGSPSVDLIDDQGNRCPTKILRQCSRSILKCIEHQPTGNDLTTFFLSVGSPRAAVSLNHKRSLPSFRDRAEKLCRAGVCDDRATGDCGMYNTVVGLHSLLGRVR